MERCCSRGAVIAWASSVATPDTSRLIAAMIGRERGEVGGFHPLTFPSDLARLARAFS